LPFMLDQGHGLLHPLCCEWAIAANPDQVQPLELRAVCILAIAPIEPFHVSVYCNQYRLIRQSRRANNIVWLSFRKNFAIEYYKMPMGSKDMPYRVWCSSIEKDAKLNATQAAAT
jgi:hypothetical protein